MIYKQVLACSKIFENALASGEATHRAGFGRVFISPLEKWHQDVCVGVIEAQEGTFKMTHSELISEL